MKTLTGFVRPGRAEILARLRAEYASRIPAGDAILPQGVLARLPELDADQKHDLHAHLDFVANQTHPLFAVGEDLDAWGIVWDVYRKPAVKAAGPAAFPGANGTVVPAGTALVRSDGVRYLTTAEATVAGGSAALAIEAETPGEAGNAETGQVLALGSPIAGLSSQGAVGEGGLAGGADVETDGGRGLSEAFRGRILDRIRTPPHGGSAADYVKWALEVPGVTRAWVYPGELGVGTVVVRFMMDGTYDDGIPLEADVAAVQAYIDERRPVTADVTVVAPVAVPLDVEIADLDPDDSETRAAIEAELADMIRERAEPGKTIKASWISEAVSVAAGEDSHEIAAPEGDVEHATGEIAVMGDVTYE